MTVQLFWARSGDGGSLLVRRRMPEPSPYDEFWRSDHLVEHDLAGGDPAQVVSGSWRSLLEGLEVGEVVQIDLAGTPRPVTLTTSDKPADPGALLFDASVWWTEEAHRLVTRRAGLRTSERDLVARYFRPGIQSALAGLGRRLALEVIEWRSADQVHAGLGETRTGRRGDHNVPAYRFLSDGELLRDGAEALRRPEIKSAIDHLLDRPQDRTRAEGLTGRLKPIDPSVQAEPVLFAPGPENEMVSRVVLFGSRGVQIGDQNVQINGEVNVEINIVLCTHDPEVAEALRNDESLGPWIADRMNGVGDQGVSPSVIRALGLGERISGDLAAFRVERGDQGRGVSEISLRHGPDEPGRNPRSPAEGPRHAGDDVRHPGDDLRQPGDITRLPGDWPGRGGGGFGRDTGRPGRF
ncbi:hypothetical protein [Paractinoplanes maris]|uniref:hypothetical protein n=1 Tax=Paractinoplanes maris TaxID=1734446 RepID=UPI0020219961|nr:hypothetical protein [Actinoplanes maris]